MEFDFIFITQDFFGQAGIQGRVLTKVRDLNGIYILRHAQCFV